MSPNLLLLLFMLQLQLSENDVTDPFSRVFMSDLCFCDTVSAPNTLSAVVHPQLLLHHQIWLFWASFGCKILIQIMQNRREGGREVSAPPDSNSFCLPPSARSRSASIIRMHRDSPRLNIVQASFSTDETMTHCGIIVRVTHIATRIIFIW